MVYTEVPKSVATFMETITEKCGEAHQDWAKNFQAAFANTLLTTVKRQEDGTTFLLTGDIPAMWLRDSTAQVRPYLVIAKEDEDLAQMIAGLVKRQFRYICIDPYANAFNETDNHAGHQTDKTEMNGWIWERKYEIDSLCYPVQLAYLLYKNTGMTEQFNSDFVEGVKKILNVFTTEQDHAQSPYLFERDTWRQEDTLVEAGKGTPSAGLMFTLQTYEQLSHKDLRKGHEIAGTGTMNSQGIVGRIGGIDKKVVTASENGAEIFFAPDDEITSEMKKVEPKIKSNYQEAQEAAKKIGTKMKIVPVKTVQDALNYLEKLK